MHIAISDDHHAALRRVAADMGLKIPEAAEKILESNSAFSKELAAVKSKQTKVTA